MFKFYELLSRVQIMGYYMDVERFIRIWIKWGVQAMNKKDYIMGLLITIFVVALTIFVTATVALTTLYL